MAESSVSFNDLTLLDWLEGLAHDSPFEPHGPDDDVPAGTRFASAVCKALPAMKDPDPKLRLRAVTALGRLGEEVHRVLPALRAALKEAALTDQDEAVRTRAVHAVLEIGPQATSEIGALIDSLQDELPVVRFHAAIALGDHGREAAAAVPALTHVHIWDADPAVRVEAAVALWKIDHKGALVVPALAKALEDDNELICWIAADCLGRIGPEAREALPALEKALERPFKMGLIATGIRFALERVRGTSG